MKFTLELFACLYVSMMQSLLCAQQTVRSHVLGCEESHRSFAPRNPKFEKDGSIIGGQSLVQSRFRLDEKTTVRVVEYPRSGRDMDDYNSTIIVQSGQEQRRYPLREMITNGAGLRLVETATLCASPDQVTIALAFEAGSTGAAEGFAIIEYSPTGITVQALPMAYEGRIVIKRVVPDEVELWSSTVKDASLCEACKKRYVAQRCKITEQKMECTQPPEPKGVLDPNKFMRARIAIQ